MPAFRRPPDWDQHAARHTALVDPVVTVRQLTRFGFARRAHTRIDHALVFSTPAGAYEAFLPPVRPSRTAVAAKRYSAVYEVDMGVHPLHEELRLPSDDDAFEFDAVVELSWQVADPALFVQSGHRDVGRLLIGELEQLARPVCRRFAVHRSSQAERELLAEGPAFGPLGTKAGLRASWTVHLRGDQEFLEHAARMRSIDHAAAEQVHAEKRGIEHDDAIDLRTTKRDVLERARTTAYEQREHEFRLLRQQHRHAEALTRAQQSVELQGTDTEKIAFYEKHLEQGGVRAWALHLAMRPEDTRLVVESLRQDQLQLVLAQLKLAEQLLDGDGAEPHELEAPKSHALRSMIDVLSQYLPGVAVPSTPAGQPSAPLPEDDSLTALEAASRAPAHERKADEVRQAPPSAFQGWEPPQGYGEIPVQPDLSVPVHTEVPILPQPDDEGGAA